MPTYLIPIQYILTDADNPVDLTALPAAEAIERIKQTYGYWGPLLDVRIEDGVAIIDLPEERSHKAGAALDKIQQAARASRSGRYQQAVTLYEDALKVLPQHTEARRELAMVQMEMGKTAAAKQNLIRVLQLDPKDAWAYLILGNLYFKHERDLGSAERYYATAAGIAPGDTYVLNSYGSLLLERGRYDEAKDLFERAIAARPEHANPYFGLAMAAVKQDDDEGALAALERMFDQPADPDARSQPVYAQARRIYAGLRGRRAERHAEEARVQLRAAMDAYCARSGIEVQVREDAALPTIAKTELAWRYHRPYHVILHARGGAESHVVAHEFEHILLDEALRAAGANRLYATSPETEGRALGAVDKELRKIRERQRIPPDKAEQYALRLVRGLCHQLLNMPLDLFIEQRIAAVYGALRDAQFVELARQMAENARLVTDAEGRDYIPQRVWQANVAMTAAFALFVDDLYGGRTGYAAVYGPSGLLPTGRKLYSLFQDRADHYRPGVEYELVDAWADELRLRDWYKWLPDEDTAQAPAADQAPTIAEEDAAGAGHRTAQQTIAMHDGGPTNPDYLADPMVQMTATMYMLGALERFSGMDARQDPGGGIRDRHAGPGRHQLHRRRPAVHAQDPAGRAVQRAAAAVPAVCGVQACQAGVRHQDPARRRLPTGKGDVRQGYTGLTTSWKYRKG